MGRKRFLETGKVINTHGVKGELKVMSLCDSPCDFLKIGTYFWDSEGKLPCNVTSKRLHGEFPLIKCEGIDSVQLAALKKNKFIYSPRQEIPISEGKHFVQDLIGLPVINHSTGKVLGTICDVLQYTVQSVYEIESGGKKTYIPAVDEFIVEIDIDKGVYIKPIEGMFEGEAYEV